MEKRWSSGREIAISPVGTTSTSSELDPFEESVVMEVVYATQI